jgi:hypothetical protein
MHAVRSVVPVLEVFRADIAVDVLDLVAGLIDHWQSAAAEYGLTCRDAYTVWRRKENSAVFESLVVALPAIGG